MIDLKRPAKIELTTEQAIEILRHMSRIEGYLMSVKPADEVILQFDYPAELLVDKLTEK